MAEKAKEKETKAVTPWRPFMDLTRVGERHGADDGGFFWPKNETVVRRKDGLELKEWN